MNKTIKSQDSNVIQTIFQPINESKINPLYKQQKNSSSSLEGKVSLQIVSQNISKNDKERLFKTQLWINASHDTLRNISKVEYYLHPTFIPNKLISSTIENNFGINITNWGIFTINAKVFSKDKGVIGLTLTPYEWYNKIENN